MENPSAATASSATSSPHPPPSPSAAPAPPPTPPSPALPPTTFVQADPQSFREVVQKLTGAAAGDSPDKLPVTAPARPAGAGPRRPPFKLLDRRPSLRKLEIKLGRASIHSPLSPHSPHHHLQHLHNHNHHHHHHHHPYLATPPAAKSPSTFPSPVSPLGSDLLFSPAAAARATAAAAAASAVDEDRAIAEKGFYLIPSPRTADPPELLPLFPLTSPRQPQASEQ